MSDEVCELINFDSTEIEKQRLNGRLPFRGRRERHKALFHRGYYQLEGFH